MLNRRGLLGRLLGAVPGLMLADKIQYPANADEIKMFTPKDFDLAKNSPIAHAGSGTFWLSGQVPYSRGCCSGRI